jgi:hypothetical protein
MVLRFLFCLTSSLLSGSVVAVLFTAMVQYAFPDDADGHRGPHAGEFGRQGGEPGGKTSAAV